jgi:hypothetical protein
MEDMESIASFQRRLLKYLQEVFKKAMNKLQKLSKEAVQTHLERFWIQLKQTQYDWIAFY